MTKRTEIHDRVLNASDKGELAEAYSDWAGSYDSDLINDMGYEAPEAAARLLASRVAEVSGPILDAGCGTGLVAENLIRLGYGRITGLDYSADMLAEARRKGIYEALHQGDMTTTLDFADGEFAAVICVGTLTLGHVGPAALAELGRVTRKGGFLCFTVRSEAWQQHDYAGVLDGLTRRQGWQHIEQHEITYIGTEGSTCQLCLYQVAGDQ